VLCAAGYNLRRVLRAIAFWACRPFLRSSLCSPRIS
jgi:hypothetical protein